MLKPLPIGTSDFRKLRKAGLEYIDKSQRLQGVLPDQGGEVFLFPRPRRFGKTLNLSMMRYFLEKRWAVLSHLFEGLKIWDGCPDHRDHFQRYPVICLTFKDLKPKSLEAWERNISTLFDGHDTPSTPPSWGASERPCSASSEASLGPVSKTTPLSSKGSSPVSFEWPKRISSLS